jgi:DNA-binding MurR/RpiR family transcriptional regulator
VIGNESLTLRQLKLISVYFTSFKFSFILTTKRNLGKLILQKGIYIPFYLGINLLIHCHQYSVDYRRLKQNSIIIKCNRKRLIYTEGMKILTDSNILDLIVSKKGFLPKKQRKLCEFIVENYKSMGVLTVSDLADKAGVGTTTVMRVIKALGYESFNDFKKEFHQYTINLGLSTWWHLQKSFSTDESEPSSSVNNSWKEIDALLNKTLNINLIENLNKAVQLILNKESVNILGLRTSKVIALYFEKLLSEFYPKTKQLSYDSEFVFDSISHFGKSDLLIIIALSPYTTLSMNVAEYCFEQGIPIILITDHYSCPVASYADVVLHTKASDKQYSIVPTIALIETLVIEIGKQTSEYSIQRLEKLGNLLKEKNITT